MVIREEQIAAFERKAQGGFAAELADYVRTQHGSVIVRLPGERVPVSAIPRPKLEALVQAGIERAGSHGLRWRSATASFVVTMFVIAPNFDEDRRVSELLSDVDIQPNYRMDSARRRLTEDQWNAIRQQYNVNSWGIHRE
ncbi:MAG: hypothetical protein ABJF23_09215 [Bryobacteraceae bacterium]